MAKIDVCEKLLHATKNGNLREVETLIKLHSNFFKDIKYKNEDGNTALMLAAENGHLAIVKSLLASGATVNDKNNLGNTALILAAENGHFEIINTLIKNGANIEDANKRGKIALTAAINSNNEPQIVIAIVEFLLHCYNNIDKKRNILPNIITALIWAAIKGNLTIVTMLLAYCNNNYDNTNNQLSQFYYVPLLWAAEKGDLAIVELLLTNGAAVNDKNDLGNTPLILAAKNGHRQVVARLLLKNTNINYRNLDGNTALIVAAENGYLDIVNLLLAKGANVNIENNAGNTALTLATNNQHLAIVNLLLTPNANDKNNQNQNNCFDSDVEKNKSNINSSNDSKKDKEQITKTMNNANKIVINGDHSIAMKMLEGWLKQQQATSCNMKAQVMADVVDKNQQLAIVNVQNQNNCFDSDVEKKKSNINSSNDSNNYPVETSKCTIM